MRMEGERPLLGKTRVLQPDWRALPDRTFSTRAPSWVTRQCCARLVSPEIARAAKLQAAGHNNRCAIIDFDFVICNLYFIIDFFHF